MASDGSWGDVVEQDSGAGDLWDSFDRLPEPGVNPALDSFVERKNITIPALLRLGAKLSSHDVLAFPFPGGIKYRDMTTGKRWNFLGSDFHRIKIVPATQGPVDSVLVCEGETDGARLTLLYPDCDVAILPAGAKHFTAGYAEQLDCYDRVLVGLDNDEAGEQGAAKIMELVQQAERFAPPPECNDWCEVETPPPIPDEPQRPPALQVLMSAGDMLELEVPEVASWFEHDILPIGGELILHGWAKSFKTFLALDMFSALAQGQDWCCFEPNEEPCKVAIVQFELPWAYYRQRVAQLLAHAREPELFKQNFLTFSPLARPRLRAGDKRQEDFLVKQLVDNGVQVMLLDPIRRATGSIDMNDEAEVRKMLSFFERLNDEGITVVATHHDNKSSAKSGGGDPTGMTGSGAWAGDPDTIVSVELPRSDKYTESVRRNLVFTLRNSPTIAPRGMTMQDDGSIVYSPTAHQSGDDDYDEAESLPSI